MQRNQRQTHNAFTLVELLVVIAIIVILIAILLPIITRVRQSAMNQVCKSNLRQIGMGIRMYTNDNKGRFADPWTLGGALCRRLVGERDPADPNSLAETFGWSALLQPYMKFSRANNVWRCPATTDDRFADVAYIAWTAAGGPNSKWRNVGTGIVDENFEYGPYTTGVAAPLQIKPGNQDLALWSSAYADLAIPVGKWRGGPHFYRLDLTQSTTFGKNVMTFPTDGYSHFLDPDLSVHIRRHYKIIINGVNSYTIRFPDLVE